ncbi:putative disease resistance protein RGA4, partial [Macadamia integrifolia]|uniref:putative disease resistance protein RGA4 n=1 Tax=Macadamia integrifolia TaxID=60698 RepID=UPI001C4F7976
MADHHPNININGEEETLCVIPIVAGSEYVATETLAKLIFDDESIKSHFDFRFWVNIGLDVKRVVKEIVELSPSRRRSTIMGGGGGDITNWNNLQHMLEEILSGKRFLLVLPHMWVSRSYVEKYKERWDNLITLLRVGSKRSAIIVTTRSYVDAFLIVGAIPSYELSERSSLESKWALFRRNAFAFGSREGGAVETPDLVRIGLELVKLGPVNMWAITILGAMMHFKTNIEEWTTVLNTMKTLRSSGHLPNDSTLMICYNEMESPLKLCFAYCCSVFPRNFIIEKKKLIQLWMAQGFLEQPSSSSSINNGGGDHDDVILMEEEDIGNAYFKSLRLRVLELKHVSKDEFPSSIGELIHLRFLQRLPKGMIKLINLRHLEFEGRLSIPKGIGQRLSNLRTLSSFKVGGNNINNEAGIEELGCRSLSLISLDNVKNGANAKAANLKGKEKLQELTLEWEVDWHVCTKKDSTKEDDVLEELQPHPNLLLLRILRFNGTKLPTWLNGSSYLSNLQELCIYSCHHVESLDLIDLRSLRKLMISYCEKMEYVGMEGHVALELVEFKGCDKLKSLGAKERSFCNSLKTLQIENCANPMVLSKGIEQFSMLEQLLIENCSNLEELPKGIGQLTSLQHFEIRECPKLMFLSEQVQHWRSLKTMSIVGCKILRVSKMGIAELTSLQELEINGCDLLFSFPDEMEKMKSLQMLKIERCSNLMDLPVGLGNPSSLEVLEISSCNNLVSLPEGMQHLKKLDRLKLKGCDNLRILPEELGNPSTLRVLDIIGCPNLTSLPEGLGKLTTLGRLEITDCVNLTTLPGGLGKLSSLRSLYIQRCHNLESFPDALQQMTSLRVLWLIECHKLKKLSSGLRSLSGLEKLTVWGCHNLTELLPPQCIQNLKSLRELTISHCSKLEILPDGLEDLSSLKELVIWKCPKLKSSSEKVTKQLKGRYLRKLEIKDCPNLGADTTMNY